MVDASWELLITLEGFPQQQPGSPEGPLVRLVGREETDYFGLRAPIDGQMNQQGPILLFILPVDLPTGLGHEACSHQTSPAFEKKVTFMLSILFKIYPATEHSKFTLSLW